MPATGVNQICAGEGKFLQYVINRILHHHLQVEGAPPKHPHGALCIDAINKFLNPGKISGNEKKCLLFPMLFSMRIAKIFVIRDAMPVHVSKKRCCDGGGDFHMVIEGNITNLIGGRTRWHIRHRILQNPKKFIDFHILRRPMLKIHFQRVYYIGIIPATGFRTPIAYRIIDHILRLQRFQRIIRFLFCPFKHIEHILQRKKPIKCLRSLLVLRSAIQPCRQIIRFIHHIGQIVSRQMRLGQILPVMITDTSQNGLARFRIFAKSAQKIRAKHLMRLSDTARSEAYLSHVMKQASQSRNLDSLHHMTPPSPILF